MAFDLFCNYKFKESMEVFFNLDICPSHVIGLFSGLLPAEFKDKLEYPDTPPVLQGRELENGLLALIEYLTQVSRGNMSNNLTSDIFNLSESEVDKESMQKPIIKLIKLF